MNHVISSLQYIDGVYLGDIGNGVVTYGTLCPYIKE